MFSTYFHTENTVRNIPKIDQIEKFGLFKKATVVSNFCLIRKIHHNFLVPRMIELACKMLPERIYNPITAMGFSAMFTSQLDNTKG